MTTQNLTFNNLPEAVTLLLNEVSELKRMLAKQTEKAQQPTPENEPDLLTIKEACEMLNISRGTLYRYEKQGKINIYGIGARRLLKRSEVLESLTVKK
ncbi:MAG TPA: helix-turn-helix domain-containing protein [Aequorivita sp.]|nr:helix-turn-helix domain-containing protein [Aequorivita sp.]